MDKQRFYDVVVVGGGPAGLTAAIYLARARYRVVVVEKDVFGGQIVITDEVVNYPGVARTNGKALTEQMRLQAESFGAEFLLADVTGLELDGAVKTVRTDRGDLSCFGVLLATGAHPRHVGFPGEEEFKGRGVAYCATCDGEFFTGKEVFVVGGGFAAAEEAVFLTRYASHVTILVRGDDFTCAPSASEPAKNHPKIDVLYNTEVVEASGDSALRRLVWRDSKTGETGSYDAPAGDTFGLFVFAGYEPATSLVEGVCELDAAGYVVTGEDRQTNVEGLFAAGDVCRKSLRQVVTATGEGALAATELERYASRLQKETGLVPERPVQAQAPVPENTEAQIESAGGYLDPAMRPQLDAVFSRMERPLVLELVLDDTPLSAELAGWMEELAGFTDKLSVTRRQVRAGERGVPCVRVCDEAGEWLGLAFHGVPGGHEFTSFVLGLYNAAGPGQPIDDESRARIAAIDRPVELQVLVSLSCTNCPETVLAAQRVAAGNPLVTAEAYDINHNKELADAYDVMSVPALVVDGERVAFGKKSLTQVLDLLG
jgi:thioredoxin reductase (NADPH)